MQSRAPWDRPYRAQKFCPRHVLYAGGTRVFKKILFVIIVLVVVGLAGAYIGRNVLVAKAVETGSEYALGTDVTLGSASVSLGAGSLELNSYEVRNPEGFDSKNIFVIGHGVIDVATGTILDREVTIDSIILDGIEVTLEQVNDDGNYSPILNHIRTVDFGQSSESDRTFRIGKIAVRDVSVGAKLTVLGTQHFEKSYTLDNFEITNVGSDGGATIGQVSAIVFRGVMSRALDKAKSELPGGFGRPVKEQVQQKLEEAKESAIDKLKDAGGSLLGGDK